MQVQGLAGAKDCCWIGPVYLIAGDFAHKTIMVDHRLGLVITGGTIDSAIESSHGELALSPRGDPRSSEEKTLALVKASWPGSNDPDIRIRTAIDSLSENLIPANWLQIATQVREVVLYEGVSSVLVLHGTDTMAYTAAALAFLLSDLKVPVVLTGANTPAFTARSDARTNVRAALIALHHLGPGTYVTFAGSPGASAWVHLGTKVRKTQPTGHTFESINREPVARIKNDEFYERALPRAPTPTPLRMAVDGSVLAFRLYPGFRLKPIYHMAQNVGIRGIIVELYPSGTGPHLAGDIPLPSFFEDCLAANIAAFITVPRAIPNQHHVYESTLAIRASGVQFLGDMLPETAIVKLMLALGSFDSFPLITRFMMTPIAEEISAHGSG